MRVQKEVFAVNAELAVKPEDYEKFASSFMPIPDKGVNELEDIENDAIFQYLNRLADLLFTLSRYEEG